MQDEYLWDKSGEPDVEIVRLEETLAQFRYQPVKRRVQIPYRLAAAAVVVLTLAASFFFWHRAPASGWVLTANSGQSRTLAQGEWIDTKTNSQVRLHSPQIGEVEVDAGSRLRVIDRSERLALDHGAIHAFIWAPPRTFVVNTPSAKTIDLGCRYTLRVAPDGSGILRVETGWVAFEWKRQESFIPAGASCRTKSGRGPGIPYFDDAPATLRSALSDFEERNDTKDLQLMLTSARPQDALSVWHLLTRTNGAERIAVFRRLSELVAIPASVSETAIERGDPRAMDATWNALELGDTAWWRGWEHRW